MKLSLSGQKVSAVGFLALGTALLPGTVFADSFLPNVSNLNFVNYTGVNPKGSFISVKPVGWSGGSGLIYIDAPGTAESGNGGIPVYGPFPYASPVGGNFVEADGNPDFDSGFNQTITGLTPGQTYTLSFYEAGGQQQGFASGLATTERWIVSLGTSGLTVSTSGGPRDPVYGPTGSYHNADPNASIVASPLMTTPSGGVSPWRFVSVTLKADAASDLLSFLAWGDNGSTINLPPMVFLSGVNSVDVLAPEPGSIFLLAIVFSLVGIAVAMRKRKARA